MLQAEESKRIHMAAYFARVCKEVKTNCSCLMDIPHPDEEKAYVFFSAKDARGPDKLPEKGKPIVREISVIPTRLNMFYIKDRTNKDELELWLSDPLKISIQLAVFEIIKK